jgi:tryptophan synthase alpha chain
VSGVGVVLAKAKSQGRAALVGYLPVGYPNVQASIDAMVAMVEAGVDVVEIGVPYTDPLMDGPVIQHAADVALRGGTRLRDVFTAVRAVVEAGAPALVMTYWNPVLHYGVDSFADELATAGGAGLITPDLIPDEAVQWIAAAQHNDLDRVFLVAPSSTPDRLRSTASACRGFVYAASTMGVTGERTSVGDAAEVLVARTRLVTDTPVCVGLGVSSGAQAAQVAAFADGVIVGSALVRCLTDDVSREDGLMAIRKLSADLAAGVRQDR